MNLDLIRQLATGAEPSSIAQLCSLYEMLWSSRERAELQAASYLRQLTLVERAAQALTAPLTPSPRAKSAERPSAPAPRGGGLDDLL